MEDVVEDMDVTVEFVGASLQTTVVAVADAALQLTHVLLVKSVVDSVTQYDLEGKEDYTVKSGQVATSTGLVSKHHQKDGCMWS